MPVKYTTPTSRATGISAASLASGANLISSAIANGTNLDRFAVITISHAQTTASTGSYFEVWMIRSDNTNYEDGGTATDPSSSRLISSVDAFNDTDTHYAVLDNVILPPKDFKILIKSESSRTLTVTVTCETYNLEITS